MKKENKQSDPLLRDFLQEQQVGYGICFLVGTIAIAILIALILTLIYIG